MSLLFEFLSACLGLFIGQSSQVVAFTVFEFPFRLWLRTGAWIGRLRRRLNRFGRRRGDVPLVAIHFSTTRSDLDEPKDSFTANAELVFLEQQLGDPRVRRGWPSVPQGDNFVLVRNQGRLIGFTSHSNSQMGLGLNRSMLQLRLDLIDESCNKAATGCQQASQEP